MPKRNDCQLFDIYHQYWQEKEGRIQLGKCIRIFTNRRQNAKCALRAHGDAGEDAHGDVEEDAHVDALLDYE